MIYSDGEPTRSFIQPYEVCNETSVLFLARLHSKLLSSFFFFSLYMRIRSQFFAVFEGALCHEWIIVVVDMYDGHEVNSFP